MSAAVILLIIIIVVLLGCLYYQRRNSTMQLGTALLLEKLWMDHMLYTREYLLRVVNKLPNVQETADRLIRNQSDLANVYNNIYPGTYDTVYGLLKDHIVIATKLVDAVINKKDTVDQFKKAWYDNGTAIAKALASVNKNYDAAYLENMLRIHLDTTIKELAALIAGKSGIPEFDTAVNHMMMFNAYLLINA